MKHFPTDAVLPQDKAPLSSLPWQARLTLAFANDAGASRLVGRSHVGPLRVQKPLYPEGREICHAIVLHPPGGVVGGDQLEIVASVGSDAKAFITTPGAAKWYKANGRISRQDVRLDIAAGATLEWMPQETIFFNTAHVRLNNSISLDKDAAYIGCEILCFGRTASGESFDSGCIEQTTSIRREGKLVWYEQGALSGGGSSMTSPLALGGRTVFATLTAVGKTHPAAVLAAIRDEGAALAQDNELFGATLMKSVLVVRYLGDSSERARRLMACAWQRLRPHLIGREAVIPRIWNT
jgi:urease accessory protein